VGGLRCKPLKALLPTKGTGHVLCAGGNVHGIDGGGEAIGFKLFHKHNSARRKPVSGAKAHGFVGRFAARLKPCPFKRALSHDSKSKCDYPGRLRQEINSDEIPVWAMRSLRG
jgi:hypothetical protein